MSCILITGGSGFIGTNLVEHYRAHGHEVTNLDVVPPRDRQHIDHWKRVDLLDRALLARAVAEVDPEIVYHVAARTDLHGTSIREYKANTEGVANLIDALRGTRRLRLAVFASSMLVCRIGYHPNDEFDYCPSTAYGESKVTGENLFALTQLKRFHGLSCVPLRFGGHGSPRLTAISSRPCSAGCMRIRAVGEFAALTGSCLTTCINSIVWPPLEEADLSAGRSTSRTMSP